MRFTLIMLVACIGAYAQPANDNCTSATSLVVNDPCVNGDTENGTLEGGENLPSCDNTQTQSTWYTFTANSSVMTVTVDMSAAGCYGTSVVYDGNTCQPSTELSCSDNAAGNIMTHNLNGNLTPGNDYLVQVIYGDGGPCGMGATYCIDVTGTPLAAHCTNGVQDADETGVDCGGVDCAPCFDCISNEECGTATNLTIVSNTQYCETGCNVGSTVGPNLTTCSDFTGATVWYTFTTPATDVYIDLSVTSTDLTEPMFTIFNTCASFLGTSCQTGTGGSASLTGYSLSPSTQYWIAVSDFQDDEGSFDLCMTTYPDPSVCNTASSLTWSPDTIPGGGWAAGTTVNFCYSIDTFANIGLQYLQGIVPSFGDGWETFDPATDITLNPVCAACDYGGTLGGSNDEFGTWTWMNSGVDINFALYGLNPGDDVGAGWFFASDNPIVSQTDPDLSWGDGCLTWSSGAFGGSCSANTVDGQLLSWNMCFNLTVKDSASCVAGENDLSVSMRTYSDGQIGNYSNSGCNADIPFTNFAIAQCVTLPMGITSFSGYKIKEGNLLKWTDFAEINGESAKYVIERSHDGEIFAEIGEVIKNGKTDYNFTDNEPFRKDNYYRLKYIEDDSEAAYSSVIVIRQVLSDQFVITNLYPLPFSDLLYVEFENSKVENVNVKLVNSNSEVLYSDDFTSNKGVSMKKINIGDTPYASSVLFMILTTSSGDVITKKVIRQ